MKTLKPHKVDWAQIERFLASADKMLASAHKIFAFDEEACLQQAYEAMLKASLGFMFSHSFRRTLRKSENLLRVLSATSGGYNSLCFPASQPYSYAGSASTRVRRLLSPTRLHKRYDISSSFSSFVVTPKGP